MVRIKAKTITNQERYLIYNIKIKLPQKFG